MNGKPNPNKGRETTEDTIERAAAQETDPLTLLETEDALSNIPDEELNSADDVLSEKLSEER